ncbi:hypothetical protein [Microbacterium radiodurans]|uniref:Uncharacterized protein n=1 Tax=Microbacterium radiodurans TaxID=661398 RepID=A0A5J5IMY0_9MICO|nr:hypothetical protein [Microbacterium radiodurans]KAA9083763.1 hypothetical protein F6B42_14540 [Microbacterium radiodurans]
MPVVALLAASVALAGCATSPGAGAPTTATPTASASPQTATPSDASATPTPSAPPASPDAATAPSAPPAPSAADVCIERHEESLNPGDGERFTGEPVVYERSLDPRWLVVIPAENIYGALYVECIVSDTDSGPQVESNLSMVADLFDDEHLQYRLNNNEGGA